MKQFLGVGTTDCLNLVTDRKASFCQLELYVLDLAAVKNQKNLKSVKSN